MNKWRAADVFCLFGVLWPRSAFARLQLTDWLRQSRRYMHYRSEFRILSLPKRHL
jgi:hypothetical protein